jgi:hypothetical protein
MQTFYFDMKDGVPMRDRVGVKLEGNAEAIVHCKELAQHIRDGSLRDDQDLEIAVVNSLGEKFIASSSIGSKAASVGGLIHSRKLTKFWTWSPRLLPEGSA